MPDVTRRRFLTYGLGAGSGLVVLGTAGARAATTSASSPLAAALASPTLTKFTETLPIPPAIDLTGGGSPMLAMASGSHQFHSQCGASGPYWSRHLLMQVAGQVSGGAEVAAAGQGVCGVADQVTHAIAVGLGRDKRQHVREQRCPAGPARRVPWVARAGCGQQRLFGFSMFVVSKWRLLSSTASGKPVAGSRISFIDRDAG